MEENISFSSLYKVLESPDFFDSPEQLQEYFGDNYTAEDLYSVVDKETFPDLQTFQNFFELQMTSPSGEVMDMTEEDRGTSGVFDWFKQTTKKLLGQDPDEDAEAVRKSLVEKEDYKIVDGKNAVAQNAYYHLAESYLKLDQKLLVKNSNYNHY